MTDETSHTPPHVDAATDAAGNPVGDVTADRSAAPTGVAAGLDDAQIAATVRQTQEALAQSRAEIADVPAEVIVTNHAMGLYELAAIHLSTSPPDFAAASLAIDALACLVDGLGDRIGEHAPLLRDALGNIRIAFVQVKGAQQPSS